MKGRYFSESDFEQGVVRPVIVSDDLEKTFPLGSERLYDGPYGGKGRIKVVGVIDRNQYYGGANGRPIQFNNSIIYPERASDVDLIDTIALSSILLNTVFVAPDRSSLDMINNAVSNIPMFDATLLSSEEYRQLQIDRHVSNEVMLWIEIFVMLFVLYTIFGLCIWYLKRISRKQPAS